MNKDSIKLGLKTLKVKCFDRYVGTLAMTPDGKVAFSYYDEWLANGFAISPYLSPRNVILMDYLVYLQIVCLMHGDNCF